MSLSRRLAAGFAIALVAFVATVPAAAACCIGRTSSPMASMHASMPCCQGSCKLTKNTARPDHEYALTSAPATSIAFVAIAIIPSAPSAIASFDSAVFAFVSPPSFLAHHQYRI